MIYELKYILDTLVTLGINTKPTYINEYFTSKGYIVNIRILGLNYKVRREEWEEYIKGESK